MTGQTRRRGKISERAGSAKREAGNRAFDGSDKECTSKQEKVGGAVRRDKTLTAPCRFVEILAGKCGFAGQLERRSDGSNARGKGNAIPFLT